MVNQDSKKITLSFYKFVGKDLCREIYYNNCMYSSDVRYIKYYSEQNKLEESLSEFTSYSQKSEEEIKYEIEFTGGRVFEMDICPSGWKKDSPRLSGEKKCSSQEVMDSSMGHFLELPCGSYYRCIKENSTENDSKMLFNEWVPNITHHFNGDSFKNAAKVALRVPPQDYYEWRDSYIDIKNNSSEYSGLITNENNSSECSGLPSLDQIDVEVFLT